MNQATDLTSSEGLNSPRSQTSGNQTRRSATAGIFQKRQVKKKPTQIFDGAIIDAVKSMAPRRTFQSKSVAKGRPEGGRAGIYLPEVAVALGLHKQAKQMLETNASDQEGMEPGLL